MDFRNLHHTPYKVLVHGKLRAESESAEEAIQSALQSVFVDNCCTVFAVDASVSLQSLLGRRPFRSALPL